LLSFSNIEQTPMNWSAVICFDAKKVGSSTVRTTLDSIARRRGRVKILITNTVLSQLADAIIIDDTVAVALMCHNREWHVLNWSR
jgi:hypothetical protein